MTIKFVQVRATTLLVGVSSTETIEIVLKDLVDIYGNELVSADFGTVLYFTIDPGSTSSEEIISATGFTVNTDGSVSLNAGIVRGLAAKSPYDATGTPRDHAAGVTVIVSNVVQLYDSLVSKTGNQSIDGVKTFNESPVVPYPGSDYAARYQAAPKFYVDEVAFGVGVLADEATAGYVQEATQAQIGLRIGTGNTGANLFIPPDKMRAILSYDYVADDTGSANAYAIAPTIPITSYVAGQRFTFKVAHANTGASTLAVSGLGGGAKTIKKLGSLDLSPNDLIVGQIVEVLYNGTNMILMTPIASNVVATGAIQPFAQRAVPTGWLSCDGSAVSRTTYAALFSALCPSLGTVTISIAAPGVVTLATHGLATGDSIYLTTSGALPTGLTANTRYWVIKNDANTFWLATSLANALAGTKITTSGTQSGAHTMNEASYGVGDGSTTFTLPSLKGLVITGLDQTQTEFAGLGQTGGEKTHTLALSELPNHTHSLQNINIAGGGGVDGVSTSTNCYSNAYGIATGDIIGTHGGSHNNLPPLVVMNWCVKY